MVILLKKLFPYSLIANIDFFGKKINNILGEESVIIELNE